MRLAQFQSLYPRDLSRFPSRVGNYPPLYHLLQLPFAWLFGPAFWYGRLINLLSILAAVFDRLTLHTLTRRSGWQAGHQCTAPDGSPVHTALERDLCASIRSRWRPVGGDCMPWLSLAE
jgi:hypothetical protein